MAVANDMIAVLAWTNGLLKRSIQAAESSTTAIGRFMNEQRVFQALFLTEIRRIIRMEKDEEKGPDTEEETERDESGDKAQMEE